MTEININDILALYDLKIAELNRQVILLTVENQALKKSTETGQALEHSESQR